MAKQGKPRWLSLGLIGLIMSVALVIETRLPFSPAVDAWLLGFLVLCFYGAIAVWVSHNSVALEREPQPLDCIGRPIFDLDSVESLETEKVEAKLEVPVLRGNAHSFSRSEAL